MAGEDQRSQGTNMRLTTGGVGVGGLAHTSRKIANNFEAKNVLNNGFNE
jgi:hypothetical protein